MASRRPRKPKPQALAARVRHLIALDAQNVMNRLQSRLDSMVALFSRLRDRGPMLAVVHSWVPSITFGELASLEPHEQREVNRHYELLAELRWYLQYTEDMPSSVLLQLTSFHRRIEASHRALIAVIGAADGVGAPVVVVRVEPKPVLRAVRRRV